MLRNYLVSTDKIKIEKYSISWYYWINATSYKVSEYISVSFIILGDYHLQIPEVYDSMVDILIVFTKFNLN